MAEIAQRDSCHGGAELQVFEELGVGNARQAQNVTKGTARHFFLPEHNDGDVLGAIGILSMERTMASAT
jgi:hypothetical protein